MSDLEEFTDVQIDREYHRRMDLLQRGRCTYCEKEHEFCECKMSKRAGMAKGVYKFIGYPMCNLQRINK